MLKVNFVMEQHVGHRTFYLNLRRFIEPLNDLESNWVPLTYEDPQSRWHKIPFFPERIKGPLIGRDQVIQGLQSNPYDIGFYSTQVAAALAKGLVQQKPYVLCTDISPIQYDSMAEHYGHRPDGDNLWSRYKNRANVDLFQKAARFVTWSQWAADSLVTDYGVDRERTVVVPVGVDLEIWHPPEEGRPSDGPVKILFVGGDLYRKGGDDLLAAFRQLPAGSAELILVTRTQIDAEPGVTVFNNMKPNTPELIRLFQTSDIFVLPTKAEAFGIVGVEASAAGLPCLVTQVGGLPEIVEHGETGFHFSAGNVEALVSHLKPLVANHELRKKMGAAAVERARKIFDARQNALQIAEIIRSAAMA